MSTTQNTSPCLHCTRVKDPRGCENKQCNSWRKWFLSRWSKIHGYYEAHGSAPAEPADPCMTCKLPQTLCTVPCRRKRAWQALREEQSQ